MAEVDTGVAVCTQLTGTVFTWSLPFDIAAVDTYSSRIQSSSWKLGGRSVHLCLTPRSGKNKEHVGIALVLDDAPGSMIRLKEGEFSELKFSMLQIHVINPDSGRKRGEVLECIWAKHEKEGELVVPSTFRGVIQSERWIKHSAFVKTVGNVTRNLYVCNGTLTIRVTALVDPLPEEAVQTLGSNMFHHILSGRVQSKFALMCSDGDAVPVHMDALIASSPVAMSLLSVDDADDFLSDGVTPKSIDVHPAGVSIESVRAFVEHIYMRSQASGWKASVDTTRDCFLIADFFNYTPLFEACKVQMMETMDVSSCLDLLVAAEQYNCSSMHAFAMSFLARHPVDVLKGSQMDNHPELMRKVMAELISVAAAAQKGRKRKASSDGEEEDDDEFFTDEEEEAEEVDE